MSKASHEIVSGSQSEPAIQLEVRGQVAGLVEHGIRRLLDLFISIVGLTVSMPLFALFAVLIRLDSPGPVFIRMARLGRGRAMFPCMKFRTMVIDGDQCLSRYFEVNPQAKVEWDTYQKLKDDPRVTRIGKFLRKTSLDELPQLWNVLVGHMSVVGPRPYLPRELSMMGTDVAIILRVRPGITGLWQVSGRNEISFRERVALERHYVETRSLGLDLILLLKTPLVLLSKRGAY